MLDLLKIKSIAKIAQKYVNPEGIFFLSLLVTGAGLGTSNSLMSWGLFGMLGAVLWKRDWKGWFKRLRSTPAYWTLPVIYLLFALGILWSENMDYALKDLRVKLPLLVIPILMAGFPPLSRNRSGWLLQCIIGIAFLVCILGTAIHFKLIPWEADDFRKISPFISHIRLSTLVTWCIFALGWMITIHRDLLKIPAWMTTGVMLYLALFLLLLKSLTGLFIFVGILAGLSLFLLGYKTHPLIRFGPFAGLLILTLFLGNLVLSEYNRSSVQEIIDPDKLSLSTPEGNIYKHYDDWDYHINGYVVWVNICHPELTQEWSKRSSIDYDGSCTNGYPLNQVLIKYLTSKGWKKNRAAVQALTEQEVKAIENGVTNFLYANGIGLRARINQTFEEYFYYRETHDPNNQSFSMRLEIWKTASLLAKQHIILGVGTGDVRDALHETFEATHSPLEEKYRMNPHQQYLTTWISIGLPAMILVIILWVLPLFFPGTRHNFLWIIFTAICLLAMLDEDTLETQAGVTQVAFLYAVTLTGMNFKKYA